ncbi:MAG TPA: hypothetical protein VK879_15470 [Candidatus Sulfomarinibacteraceae bacterium]|nr:hypothetical protein [Candidatus Sulfomarinibacteraceae bacterium]
MESDEVYTLMMEALDGELSENGKAELETHLRAHPELAREWKALQRIDTLLRSAPMARPAADFAQRTMARLPGARQRLWIGVAIYVMMLAGGLIPLAVIGAFGLQMIPALSEPAFFRGIWLACSHILQVLGVMLGALLRGAGELVGEQPTVLAWLVVMVGVVALWLGVYSRLVFQPRRLR